jgi:hypothetical protein
LSVFVISQMLESFLCHPPDDLPKLWVVIVSLSIPGIPIARGNPAAGFTPETLAIYTHESSAE